MPAKPSRSYCFRSLAQWQSCVSDGIEWKTSENDCSCMLATLYADQPCRSILGQASQPFLSDYGDLNWCTGARLCRIRTGLDIVESMFAPESILLSERTAVTKDFVWTLNSSKTVNCFDVETRTLVRTFTLETDLIDIASGENNSIYALTRTSTLELLSMDCNGDCTGLFELANVQDADSFVLLPKAKSLVVFVNGSYPELHWFSLETGKYRFSVPVSRYSSCFSASLLGSNQDNEAILIGRNSAGDREIVIVNSEGHSLQTIPWNPNWGEVTGLVGSPNSLVITTVKGLFEFRKSKSLPSSADTQASTILTPALRARQIDSTGPWLRADIEAELPNGSKMDVVALSTDDVRIRERIDSIWNNRVLSVGEKWRSIVNDPELHQIHLTFGGSSAQTQPNQSLSIPLFDLRDEHLWIGIGLTASAGSTLPQVNSLNVIYHGSSLMDHLPSIYQRDASQPGSFLRSFVGVMEKTTQSLDQQIRGLGTRIRSTNDSPEWLDFVADWVGIPWNQGLSLDQKQRLIECAAELTSHRGTRRGLTELLQAIVGGKGQFRITDLTADCGFAILGGPSKNSPTNRSPRPGCQLPALLGGAPQGSMTLDSQAVLGRSRLPDDTNAPVDPAAAYCGHIKIELAATRAERDQWECWLESLIQQFLPIGTNAKICWVGPQALEDHNLTLDSELKPLPLARLGTDAVTGRSAFPLPRPIKDQMGQELPIRLK